MTASQGDEPLTYGSYLHVPDLLRLQAPLARPEVHDEMLFIVGQQVQELWFKQILHDLKAAINMLGRGAILEAANLLDRINRILRLLSAETEILEFLPPRQFHFFRGYLKAASGFESEQFRELEMASGLRDEAYVKIVSRFIDVDAMLARWPVALVDAFRSVVQQVSADIVDSLVHVYEAPDDHPAVYLLAEALSEYELRFQEWRFHHIQVVERVIGDRASGTGGSAGAGYLMRTLNYQFFPELWEARNRLTSRYRHPATVSPALP